MWRLIPALSLILAGCASTSSGSPPSPTGSSTPTAEVYSSGSTFNIDAEVVEATQAFQASPEAVWEALIRAYEELEIEVAGKDPNGRVLGNPEFVVSRRLGGQALSRYLRCGSGITGAFADQYRIHMNIISRLNPGADGSTTVMTTIEAFGINPRGSSNTRVACTSTHALEGRIASTVAEFLG